MTREEKIQEAERLRADGLSYRAIGERLGVTNSTVLRWLNPSKDDQYRQTVNERYANDSEYREKQKQRRREQRNDPEFLEKERRYNRERWANNTEYRERQKQRRRNRRNDTELRFNDLLSQSKSDAKRRGHEQCNATVAELFDAFNECGGCCQCCGKHESELSKRLVIDHNHTTGKFRGFLCDNCNRGIGFLEDSAYLAFNYLDPDRSQLFLRLLSKAQ